VERQPAERPPLVGAELPARKLEANWSVCSPDVADSMNHASMRLGKRSHCQARGASRPPCHDDLPKRRRNQILMSPRLPVLVPLVGAANSRLDHRSIEATKPIQTRSTLEPLDGRYLQTQSPAGGFFDGMGILLSLLALKEDVRLQICSSYCACEDQNRVN
jgi:hypothetical protein